MSVVLISLAKSLILFITLLTITRLMGKRQISELSHFDYIAGITLGTIAGAACVDERLSYYNVIISILIWSILPITISKINVRNLKFKRITSGKPIIIIENGIVNDKNLIKARYNIEDLFMQLRQKDIFNISEVEFALLETDGQLSILKKSQYHPLTPKDMNITTEYKGPTLDLVICGKVIEANLELSGKNLPWIMEQLKQQNIQSLKNVIFAGLLPDGHLQVIIKNNIAANGK